MMDGYRSCLLQIRGLALLVATCAAIACMLRVYMHSEVMLPVKTAQFQALRHSIAAVSSSGINRHAASTKQQQLAISYRTCPTSKPLTPIKTRGHIGLLLHEEGFKVGAELGVQAGQFASETLQSWHNCTR